MPSAAAAGSPTMSSTATGCRGPRQGHGHAGHVIDVRGELHLIRSPSRFQLASRGGGPRRIGVTLGRECSTGMLQYQRSPTDA